MNNVELNKEQIYKLKKVNKVEKSITMWEEVEE